MSLAMYAAPFNDNSQYSNIDKKQSHNKTQRKQYKENFDVNKNVDVNKVNSVLEEIHNQSSEYDNNLGDFNPPGPPDSVGVNKTISTEQNVEQMNVQESMGRIPQPNNSGENSQNLYNYGNIKNVEEYYKKIIPGYDRLPVNKPYYNMNYSQLEKTDTNVILLQKLNYMINLLEEKQDEKTNNVIEEVILYSFLGIFIIFVVDSFARVGKYVR